MDMIIESKQNILKHRKEIKEELVDMIKETKSDFSLQNVLDAVFYEEDNEDMMKIISVFYHGGGTKKLHNIVELVNKAWIYFPHKSLNCLSLSEELLKYKSKK
jgi:hypothetical protein